MAFDPAISHEVHAAFRAVDVNRFRSLLSEHPEFLRHPDGTERWMWQAAMKGYLPLIETLVDLGIDVNESKDLPDPEDPFSQVEGAILQAAGAGQLETVRWLLSHGAQVNYVVGGKARCLPLLQAATEGHLDVVKLLVENGADWKSPWNGHTALSQATNYGHIEISNYLQSLNS